MGAQWVHGKEDNPVFALASAVGEILLDSETSIDDGQNIRTAYPQDGYKLSPTQVAEFRLITESIFESALTELTKWDKSLGEFYLQK